MTAYATFLNRRHGMIGEVAEVIKMALEAGRISTPFGLEGTLTAALRSDLCLRGWRWRDAHQVACDIVGGAHFLLGAERPNWNEGQSDYVISEGLLIERSRCKRCHRPLPEECRKYCGKLCRDADHHAQASLRAASADTAAHVAVGALGGAK